MSADDALPTSGDRAHDRRVRARLADLAAERGLPAKVVLAQLNAALADGQPLVPPSAAASAAADPKGPRARVIAQCPADDEWGVTTSETYTG
ncbi:hypothetical protein AB0A98_37380, partial [Streptomyces chrestomyceticus]|uniref:hypothetical protein n=1 Tax=Streptomyces chrestomyceticus TaxID=68185 RepID=UPI003470FF41